MPPTSQVSVSQPAPYPYISDTPTYAPLPSQLQVFGGTDYQHHPKNFVIGIKARTLHHLGTETTNSDQYRIWNIRRRAMVAISFDGPALSWFNSLSEIDTQESKTI